MAPQAGTGATPHRPAKKPKKPFHHAVRHGDPVSNDQTQTKLSEGLPVGVMPNGSDHAPVGPGVTTESKKKEQKKKKKAKGGNQSYWKGSKGPADAPPPPRPPPPPPVREPKQEQGSQLTSKQQSKAKRASGKRPRPDGWNGNVESESVGHTSDQPRKRAKLAPNGPPRSDPTPTIEPSSNPPSHSTSRPPPQTSKGQTAAAAATRPSHPSAPVISPSPSTTRSTCPPERPKPAATPSLPLRSPSISLIDIPPNTFDSGSPQVAIFPPSTLYHGNCIDDEKIDELASESGRLPGEENLSSSESSSDSESEPSEEKGDLGLGDAGANMSHVAALQTELGYRDSEITRLKKEIADLAGQAAEVRELRGLVASKQARVTELEGELSQARQKNEGLAEAIKTLQHKLDYTEKDRTTRLELKDGRIQKGKDALREAKKGFKAKEKVLHNTLNSLHCDIAARDISLEENDSKMAAVKAELEKRAVEEVEFKKASAEATYRIAELERAVAAKEETEAEYKKNEAVMNGTLCDYHCWAEITDKELAQAKANIEERTKHYEKLLKDSRTREAMLSAQLDPFRSSCM